MKPARTEADRLASRGRPGPMKPARMEETMSGGPAVRRATGPVCEMPVRRCGATAVLLGGGPVRVPFRACCAAALVQGLRGAGPARPEHLG